MGEERRRWCGILAALCVALCLAGCAVSGTPVRPVALVIGNGAYTGAIPALPNPEHDAATVAARMRNNGFTTILLLDASKAEMERTFRAFADLAVGAPLAVLYYSGHGVEIGGHNLLLPVDFRINDGADADTIRHGGVALADVDTLVSGRAGGTLIILDACRTDPTQPAAAASDARGLPSIPGVGVGLGGEQVARATVVYATEPGKTALDGDGQFSPFTTSVLQHINKQSNWDESGFRFSPFLPLLRLSVMEMTGGQQAPTWRGPQLPATRGYSATPGPPIQRIVTAADPAENASNSVNGLPSIPVQGSLRGVSVCRSTSSWAGGILLTALTTSQDSPLCGGTLGMAAATPELVDPPQHGRVAFGDQVYGYVPAAGFHGRDAFTFKLHLPGGMNGIRKVEIVVTQGPVPRRRGSEQGAD